jgi:HK97 family phage major capsid protein
MKKKTLKALSNAMRKIANSLSPESKEIAVAIQEFIAEAESSDEELTAEALTEKINAIIAEKMKEAEKDVEKDVENKIKIAVANALLENPKKEVKNYLASKSAVKDFLSVVNSARSRTEFFSMWNAKLIENDIDPNGVFLPVPVIQRIQDNWERPNGFLTVLRHTGLKSFKLVYNQADENARTSRAAKAVKGETKESQVPNFVPKTITSGLLYKAIYIDRETLLNNDNEAALLNYIADELARQLENEIIRDVLVGDGYTDANHFSNLIPIFRETSDYFVTVSTAAEYNVLSAKDIRTAVDSLKNRDGREVVLVLPSNAAKSTLAEYKYAEGGTVSYRSDEELMAQLNVSRIFVRECVTGNASAIIFIGDAYNLVGETQASNFEQFNLRVNQQDYLTEILVGGDIVDGSSAAVILPAPEPEPIV